MKRIVSLALVVLLIAALFVGCGNSSVEGTYLIKSMGGMTMEDMLKAVSGDNFDLDAVLSEYKVSSLGELITMELKADGTVTVKDAMDALDSDEDSTVSGTWKQEGDKVSITIDGDTQEFTLNGSELSGGEGDEAMVFVKK